MKVTLELDDEKPRDRAILALVFGQVEPLPENAATDELVQGRDELVNLFQDWLSGQEEPLVRRIREHGPEVETYVAACGGLRSAVEAVTSGTAGLSPTRAAEVRNMAWSFVVVLRNTLTSNGIPIPELWRSDEP